MVVRNVDFLLKNMTPGTMRCQEDAPQGEEMVGPLYIKNWAHLEDAQEGGEVIGYNAVFTPIFAKKAAPRVAAAKKAPAKAAAATKKAPAGRPASK